MNRSLTRSAAALLLLSVPATAHAQDHTHTPGMTHPTAPTALPTQGGQAAFAAISEIIALLEADGRTDWSKVNLERLRVHLVDMDLVTMQSEVTTTETADGAVFVVRGTTPVAAAIKRMTAAHGAMLAQSGGPRWVRTELADGVRLAVSAADPTDAASIARVRGLGFIGLMALGNHHQAHHLALARGDAMADHGHW